MHEISIFRLNLLRAGYLILVAGLGATMWPQLLSEGPRLELMHGVELSMLCALGLLAVLGLRYPLRMLPLLLFEITWKVIWLVRIGFPLWASHRLQGDTANMFGAIAMVAVFPFLVPWDHVAHSYLGQAPEPWRQRKGASRDAVKAAADREERLEGSADPESARSFTPVQNP